MPHDVAAIDDPFERVVEEWWCPVCNGPAHRTGRPGRPRLYCSNACRQRAYRWRRDHHARIVAVPGQPASGALVVRGRWHALRSERDFMAHLSDQRRRRPTVCGVLAKPSRLLSRRTHHQFVPIEGACRRCAVLIAVPVDPLAGPPSRERSLERWYTPSVRDAIAYVERLDPTHPIRRHPERYGQLTAAWREHRARYFTSDQRRTTDTSTTNLAPG